MKNPIGWTASDYLSNGYADDAYNYRMVYGSDGSGSRVRERSMQRFGPDINEIMKTVMEAARDKSIQWNLRESRNYGGLTIVGNLRIDDYNYEKSFQIDVAAFYPNVNPIVVEYVRRVEEEILDEKARHFCENVPL